MTWIVVLAKVTLSFTNVDFFMQGDCTMKQEVLADWNNDDYNILEKGVLLAKHRMAETGLFTDEHLAHIIDTHPDSDLTISTMGRDTNKFEWREGDRNGVSGEVILNLVRQGHLWINCRNMLRHHVEFREMINEVYDELEERSPGFRAEDRSANLLISSPDALVHYHIDIPVNMLWHVRGRKRVWVYPHFDFRFVSQKVVEMVCSGEFSEDVPYDPEFDKYALVYDVEPGQLLTWPQMAPHRVTNLDGLNVSLSTEHKNPTAVRRVNVHLANQLLRRTVGRWSKSTKVDGAVAHIKQSIARVHRYTKKLFGKPKEQFVYPVTIKVDPTSPTGYTLLDVPADKLVAPHIAAEFAIGK